MSNNIEGRVVVIAGASSGLGDATAAIKGWMTDYNEVHPHSRLGHRSPREYIRAIARPAASPV